MVFIAFAFIYRSFCLFYYIAGKLLHKEYWMAENIFFIASIALSAIIGMLIWRYKYYEKDNF